MKQVILALLTIASLSIRAAEPETWDYPAHIKPIIEQRCMVCHGCYDAPCQLKMDDWIGLNRGASKDKVYDGTRLRTAKLTRLYEDALSDEQWRDKGFYPVLEREDITQSVLYKMLALKEKYPQPTSGTLPDHFDFSLDRNQSCPKPNQFGLYNRNRPQQGMPYGLPGVDTDTMKVLADWLHKGAPGERVARAPAEELNTVARWEAFLNGDSAKQQLMSRYIFEHLFIGNIHFDELPQKSRWYRMVRSHTPPGQPIQIIASRRPYDDPGVEAFYYRLQPRQTSILAKRHMPYALNTARMQRWQQLFIDKKYTVTSLPSYASKIGANPFVAFRELPVDSRYKFMLDEAQFTIMGFIKGPVCRGQVALNVIDDHFWVAFARPNNLDPEQQEEFLAEESKNLRIPRPKSGLMVTILQWHKYAERQQEYVRAEAKRAAEIVDQGILDVDLGLIWTGGAEQNPNAALTIFRHYDSASVVKGLVGQRPDSMWFIDYSLLERIHYLLVAGFDVYGPVGHQLESRLYMDFLRMEGEASFLMFLPEDQRRKLRNHWYRGAKGHVRDFVMPRENEQFERETNIEFSSDDPKRELMDMLKDHIPSAENERYAVARPQFKRLMAGRGAHISYLPEVAFVQLLKQNGQTESYSLVHNRMHSNNAQLFDEQERLIPEEDRVTIVKGFIGTYPNMFFQVHERELEDFADAIEQMVKAEDYTALVERYGVRRTAPWFWRVADTFVDAYKKDQPVEAGLFDLNRYQNR